MKLLRRTKHGRVQQAILRELQREMARTRSMRQKVRDAARRRTDRLRYGRKFADPASRTASKRQPIMQPKAARPADPKAPAAPRRSLQAHLRNAGIAPAQRQAMQARRLRIVPQRARSAAAAARRKAHDGIARAAQKVRSGAASAGRRVRGATASTARRVQARVRRPAAVHVGGGRPVSRRRAAKPQVRPVKAVRRPLRQRLAPQVRVSPPPGRERAEAAFLRRPSVQATHPDYKPPARRPGAQAAPAVPPARRPGRLQPQAAPAAPAASRRAAPLPSQAARPGQHRRQAARHALARTPARVPASLPSATVRPAARHVRTRRLTLRRR